MSPDRIGAAANPAGPPVGVNDHTALLAVPTIPSRRPRPGTRETPEEKELRQAARRIIRQSVHDGLGETELADLLAVAGLTYEMGAPVPTPHRPGKPCARCREHKPAAAFYRDRGAKTGLSSWCRQCRTDTRHPRNTTQK